MSGLLARPVGLGSWAFNVFDGPEKVARVATPGFRAPGEVDLLGPLYGFRRPSVLRREWVLSFAGIEVGRAERRSALRRTYGVALGPEISGTGAPRTLALAASFAYRTFRATEGGVDAGRVRRASWIGRDVRVALDPSLPLAARLFVFAVVADEWRLRTRSG